MVLVSLFFHYPCFLWDATDRTNLAARLMLEVSNRQTQQISQNFLNQYIVEDLTIINKKYIIFILNTIYQICQEKYL